MALLLFGENSGNEASFMSPVFLLMVEIKEFEGLHQLGPVFVIK